MNTSVELNQERDYGIDLLRVVAMIYIVMLHGLKQGGLLFACDTYSGNSFACWALYGLTKSGVNIFALISGFVAYKDQPKRFKPGRVFDIWFQTVFYGLLSVLICDIFIPTYTVDTKYCLELLFPLFNDKYWYTTAYIGLFFLMPIIDSGVRSMNNTALKRLLCYLLGIFSVFAVFTNDVFCENGGFSVIWLAILYFCGAVVKKTHFLENLKGSTTISLIALSVVIPMLWAYRGKAIGFRKYELSWDFLYSYLSPFMIILAVMHILIYMELVIPNPLKKILSFVTPSVYAVYLLNAAPPIYENIVADSTVYLADMPMIVMLAGLLLVSLGWFFLAVTIDRIRMLFFRLIGVDKLCLYINERFGFVV